MDGTPYYEYLLVYVDDVLAISIDPKAIMEDIGKSFTIKDSKYGPPETYLGANIEKVQLDDGLNAWSMHSRHYVRNLIKTVEDLLQEDGRQLKGRWSSKSHTTPLPKTYKLELDDTRLCTDDHTSR